MRAHILGLLAFLFCGGSFSIAPRASHAVEPAKIESYLREGKLADGARDLQAALLADPRDERARMGLGVVQFLRGVEQLAQSLHRHGIHSNRMQNLPFIRIPVPPNDRPEPLTYAQARQMLIDFQSSLAQADATLSGIQDQSFKLPLRLMETRLDVDGDGKIALIDDKGFSYERLGHLAQRLFRDFPQEKQIDLDYADALWLRGYCHLLLGLSDILLAHDGQDMFNVAAHLFVAKPVTPYQFLVDEKPRTEWFSDISDIIATIHMFRLPVSEPKRLESALAHWEQMFALSREQVRGLQAETDREQEWIPNPQQVGWQGARVTKEQFNGWLDFVTEMEGVLAGKKLLPFWRGDKPQGVNLRRVFLEPRTLDPVLWFQGTAAAPYLEEGTLVDTNLLNRLQQTFRGDFFGFALWVN